jgi:WD40 repeat protein
VERRYPRAKITELAGVGSWAVAFSPDGRLLATGDDPPGLVRIWDVATWHQVGDPFPVDAVDLAFSPDGRTLATVAGPAGGYPDRVWLWDVASHRQLSPLTTGDRGGT